MAVKSKAPAKSTKAVKAKAPSKARPAAKSAASKTSASRKTVTKLKTKTTSASKTKKSVAASTRKTASAKPATKKTTAAKTKATAKKAVASKKTTAKAAVKKTVVKKAAAVKATTKTTKTTTAPKTKAAAKKTASTTTKKAVKKTVKKTASTATKTAAKAPAKKAVKKTTKRASKQTAASRKAVLTAAAKKFQSTILSGQKLNVSGNTRATALAAAAKPKQTSVRALAASVSSPSSGKKISTPASGAPETPKDIAKKAAEKKSVSQRHGFKTNEQIVYPAHGVGKIIGIEEQEIAGMALELFVIHFEKEKLTLRVPTGKLESVGMRKLSDDAIITKSMSVLKGRARVKRTMWSRRAQEYVAKINSGDLVQIAEVVRDLYRSEAQPEQSYSERQLYEDALDRMAREVAAVDKLDERGAIQRIVEVLSKSARSRRALEESNTETSDETKAA